MSTARALASATARPAGTFPLLVDVLVSVRVRALNRGVLVDLWSVQGNVSGSHARKAKDTIVKFVRFAAMLQRR